MEFPEVRFCYRPPGSHREKTILRIPVREKRTIQSFLERLTRLAGLPITVVGSEFGVPPQNGELVANWYFAAGSLREKGNHWRKGVPEISFHDDFPHQMLIVIQLGDDESCWRVVSDFPLSQLKGLITAEQWREGMNRARPEATSWLMDDLGLRPRKEEEKTMDDGEATRAKRVMSGINLRKILQDPGLINGVLEALEHCLAERKLANYATEGLTADQAADCLIARLKNELFSEGAVVTVASVDASISRLLAKLAERGYVERFSGTRAGKGGPPPKFYRPTGKRAAVLEEPASAGPTPEAAVEPEDAAIPQEERREALAEAEPTIKTEVVLSKPEPPVATAAEPFAVSLTQDQVVLAGCYQLDLGKLAALQSEQGRLAEQLSRVSQLYEQNLKTQLAVKHDLEANEEGAAAHRKVQQAIAQLREANLIP